jgi:hypothetical protein
VSRFGARAERDDDLVARLARHGVTAPALAVGS